jgi:hypothetical protein
MIQKIVPKATCEILILGRFSGITGDRGYKEMSFIFADQ